MSGSVRETSEKSLSAQYILPSVDWEFLLDSLPDAVMLLAPDGTIMAMNAETGRRLGLTREQSIGKSIYDFLPSDIAALRRVKVAELMRTGHPLFFEDRHTGRVIDIHMYPLPDTAGGIGRIAVVGRDVTVQRMAEESLHACRMQLHQTLRMGKMGAWEWDAHTNTMRWSEETYRLHDMDPFEFSDGSEDHVSRSLACYDPEAASMVYAAFRRCVERGESYDVEALFTSSKGRKRWVRTGAEAIRDVSGEVIMVVGYITDVSDRRTSEEALRQSEQKFRTLVDEAAEMLFVHDMTGRICEVNRAAVEGTGYTREELLGLHVWDLDPDADSRKDRDFLWMGISPGSRAALDARHRRKNGTEYPAEVRIAKVEIGGQPYIMALASDISKRRADEQKIRASEQRLNTLLDNLPWMVYRSANNPNWTMEFVSEGALPLTGYAPGDLLGDNGVSYASLIHPADRRRVWTEIQEALDRDMTFMIEYRIFDAQGAEKWVWEKGRCVDDKTIEGFIMDISGRKRYEEAQLEKTALEKQIQQLQKADSINRLVGAVAHHFNNKLHGVIASLELAKLLPEQGGRQDKAEVIDIAMDAAQQAADLSRLMLACLGQSQLKRQRLNLADLCRDLLPALSAAMPETVLLEFTRSESDLDVLADKEALGQVLTHLVANALEALGTRHIQLRTMRMSPDGFGEGVRHPRDWNPKDGSFAVIEVEDDGPGMSAAMVEQIFDPFFSTKFTGRGIGLTLVLGLTRSHGGGVVVKSIPGKGSVFRVCIPAAAAGAGPAEYRVAADAANAASGMLVLLAEDEPPMRELAVMMLQSLGFRVLEAANGREALALAEAHRGEIGCVFSDIRMPEMDGWELLHALRRQTPDLPVILATAYDDAVAPPDGERARPDATIRKPYLIKDIKQVMERVLPAPAVKNN